MSEQWKDIPAYGGVYQASTLGRVKRIDGDLILKPYEVVKGDLHKSVALKYKGEVSVVGLHRVIASTFVPNPRFLNVVHHKDFNPDNNKPSNLMWVTNNYNLALGNGRRSPYIIKLYSRGSNLERVFTDRVTFISGFTDNKRSQTIWRRVTKYMTQVGDREYQVSKVVYDWLVKNYETTLSTRATRSNTYANNRKGKGSTQVWFSSLTEEEQAQVTDDTTSLTHAAFKRKYGKDLRYVKAILL